MLEKAIMSQNLQSPRGTYDALPEQARRLRFIEDTAARVLASYGYGEIRTPIFEHTDVFARHVGESTDIVTKEMYTFEDKGGESMTLRPEGTAAVVRAYYANGLKQHLPLKLCYIGAPMFRYERPQKGRFRQFHQIGVEIFGIASPWADVECIAAGVALMRALGLGDGLFVRLNTLGSPEDRAAYREKLTQHFSKNEAQLSGESRVRLHKNPLRILDSKEPEDQPFIASAPRTVDCLSAASAQHFATVQEGLTALGIPFEITPTLVRGLDYYTHTVFEIHGANLGAQSQVIGGGRFDGLIERMGGDAVPAVGWGCGVERLEMMLAEQLEAKADIAILPLTAAAKMQAHKIAFALRARGKSVALALEDELSFKAQLKRADKVGAAFAVILGEEELAKNTAAVKNMLTGEQTLVPLADIVQHLA